MSNHLDLGVRVVGEDINKFVDVKSKTALRKALSERPTDLVFYSTSAFGDNAGQAWLVSAMPEGEHYIVGPNPYTNRKWYGQVIVKDGVITVK